MKFDIIIKDCTIQEIDTIVLQLSSNPSFGVALARETHRIANTDVPVTGVAGSVGMVAHPHFDSENPPAPPATAGISLPETDSTGLPYDERIHSSTKAKNKDGSWKQRRNVDEATVTAVEAELKGHYTPGSVAVTQVAPVIPTPAAAEPPRTSMFKPAPVVPVATSTPPAPPAPPIPDASATITNTTPAAPAAPAPITFGTLTQRITNGFVLKKIDATYAPSICVRVSNHFGIPVATLTDLMNNQTMIEFADSLITADNAGF